MPWDSTQAERDAFLRQKQDEYATMKHQWTSTASAENDVIVAHLRAMIKVIKSVLHVNTSV